MDSRILIFRLSDRFTVFVPDIIRIALFAGLEISAIVLGFYSHEALFSKKESATDRIKTWMVTEVEITYALEEHILHCF